MNVVNSLSSAASGIGSSAAAAVGLGPEAQQESELKIFEDQCKLSKTNRMIGFCVCMGLGFLLSMISFWSIAKPTSFALLFTTGNILSLAGTGFMIGFVKQAKYACDSKRAISTIIFLVALCGTLGCALGIPNSHSGLRTFLCIFFIVFQYCALVWYTASYIPFGQQAIKSVVCSCVGRATT